MTWRAIFTRPLREGEHLARALRAARSLLTRVTSQRKAAAEAAAEIAAKHFEPAFWAATRALKLSWRAAPLYLLRARASVELNLYSQAKVDVSAALQLHPKSPDALRLLAEALRRCVRTTQALRAAVGVLRDCLRSAPDDAQCRAQLREDKALLELHGTAPAPAPAPHTHTSPIPSSAGNLT